MTSIPSGAELVEPPKFTHLRQLEAESIHILREVVAEFEKPVMLFSIGKDSMAMLHLAKKAFHPAPLPFPLLHVDTTWKFRDMYAFRDKLAKDWNLNLLVHRNEEALAQGINPFDYTSQKYTTALKTHGLLQALKRGGYDAAFGGARRDEEKSRAKERVYSFRDREGQWDPKNQRPELWNLYNGRVDRSNFGLTGAEGGESIRVFPLSNWTELDVWQYVWMEKVPVVPLYFAEMRPVVDRKGMLVMVDDDRMRLHPGEKPTMKRVRFRTLGCYPLSGAIESDATTLPEIIREMLVAKSSERQGRMIDHDEEGSMEVKKREGYF
ncbi:MAG: sulfate adenylyltransferase subunit CysD [Polyangiaceae bacterium]